MYSFGKILLAFALLHSVLQGQICLLLQVFLDSLLLHPRYKIRDKGTFHAKMGTIKDRNGMDLTEAEEIKKSWQEYTELYKKDLSTPGNHDHSPTARHRGVQS